uniref:Uncharacterized protein n=1 Tax=Chromera velia CCMP2878 TaxID=1169474 RepID=A0A0G4I978_9ALVE|eukprot:Cvel_12201.t1-p1 / transcript=Cvel_12201.t1 / gene=Cvel_12201 / organism=Chromera_velia_CCMP2878 / gene_product=hypothetical protein / transcript_product=hypothetical protein / location=Cvel_scaffold789:4481-6679(-) / protein_length=262 / sequence_SO=supercontig / SO=protein_coding / is_pseudo=false
MANRGALRNFIANAFQRNGVPEEVRIQGVRVIDDKDVSVFVFDMSLEDAESALRSDSAEKLQLQAFAPEDRSVKKQKCAQSIHTESGERSSSVLPTLFAFESSNSTSTSSEGQIQQAEGASTEGAAEVVGAEEAGGQQQQSTVAQQAEGAGTKGAPKAVGAEEAGGQQQQQSAVIQQAERAGTEGVPEAVGGKEAGKVSEEVVEANADPVEEAGQEAEPRVVPMLRAIVPTSGPVDHMCPEVAIWSLKYLFDVYTSIVGEAY